MQEKLRKMLENALTELEKASSEKDTEDVRIRFLGKKGEITEVMKSMGKLSPEERKELGRAANEVKDRIQESLKAKAEEIKQKAREGRLRAERIDVTEPGIPVEYGVKHPITQVIEEITDIFSSLGYSVYEGPDIDTVFNTFDGLNSPPTHPARDMTDTFYVTPDIVLRPHTSSAEIRAEQGLPVPYKIVIPGRCYRCDTPDATHSHTFHQIEMMVIGEDITMADLKGTLDMMAKKL
ncbi:MAG: phenylalanine--tRNA ligase subunit alpha, partial [Firmicutes bacterium]|nr:phenylalanine--tRNA ligase subunit alpha [Bacillota bacterium]